MKEYNTIKTCNEIKIFIEELSTWYVRRNRDRFNEGDKEARETLAFVLQELSKVISPIMPFIAEIIYHNVVDEKDSVHLQEWPKYDEKSISKEINEKMQKTREVVSLALKERDQSKISLKQPLAKLEVSGFDLSKEYLDLIKEEINVKEVKLNKNKEISVKLDTNITKELEAEGFAREISRKVQALRKEKGLVKENEIDLVILVDENLKKLIDSQKEFLKERTNSKKVEIISKKPEKKYEAESKDKIKEKDIEILFNKIK